MIQGLLLHLFLQFQNYLGCNGGSLLLRFLTKDHYLIPQQLKSRFIILAFFIMLLPKTLNLNLQQLVDYLDWFADLRCAFNRLDDNGLRTLLDLVELVSELLLHL